MLNLTFIILESVSFSGYSLFTKHDLISLSLCSTQSHSTQTQSTHAQRLAKN